MSHKKINIEKKLGIASAVLILALMVMIAMPTVSKLHTTAVTAELRSPSIAAQATVNLGSAGNFVILSKSGISTTGTTAIEGDIGVSPITSTAMTGFGLIMDGSNQFALSSLVTGKVYASDYASPTPTVIGTAISDMETAYTDAAGRTLPDYTELGAGNIGGMTLTPGLYKWSSAVTIPTDVTLFGNSTGIWIFQIAQTLVINSATQIILSGGAKAANIFWQVTGQTTLGTTSIFNGNILCATAIVINTGATLNGRALAQTAVTLDANAITVPIDILAPTVSSTIPANKTTGVTVNSAMIATFSEKMDPLTINTTTFTLKQGTTPVSSTVSYSGVTAILTPASNLDANTTYTANISIQAKDLDGNALAKDYLWNFTTGLAPDIIAPTLTLKVPSNGATLVLTNTKISATFSEAMDPLTLNATTFTLMQGATPITGTVIYSVVTAIFTPTNILAPSTTYIATITTGSKDLAGNALATNNVWNFTTGAALDTIRPWVVSTIPANSSMGVTINSAMSATFSEAMDPLTITTITFTLKEGLISVLGTVIYSGVTAIFTPSSSLKASTTYTAMITTGAKDLAGNLLLRNYGWNFTTGVVPDITQPSVLSTIPANFATDVSVNNAITATFSEVMDPLTITTVTFILKQGSTLVSGSVHYIGIIATFTPSFNLAYSTTYTAIINNTEVKDLAGNSLTVEKEWSFTTGKTSLLPVNLGSTGNFVILTKTGITTTGNTSIVGDIGVSPIAAAAMTGFGLIMDASNKFSTSSLVTGNIYAANYAPPTPTAMTTAISDMQIAYTDAAGRTLPDYIELGAGNLGGMTLTPGLYKWSSGVTIPTDIILLGSSSNDVWIFQIAQGLTFGSNVHVILSGGAQANNIFWQVAGQTTLGTTSSVYGNILCATAIVFNTGATLNGRALAQTAVTLNANSIKGPTDKLWVFTTTIVPDTTAPTMISTIPVNGTNSGVALNSTLTAIFSEAMNPSTISNTTFSLKQGTTEVFGNVTYSGVTAIFTPEEDLAPGTTYTITITTGAKDLAGNALVNDYVYTFTTDAADAADAADLDEDLGIDAYPISILLIMGSIMVTAILKTARKKRNNII